MAIAKHLFLLLALGGNLCAQDTFKKLERYYTGIGIELYKIESTTKIYGTSGATCDNSNGQFSDKIIIGRVLENGPASEAGLQTCDVINAIYGKDFRGKSGEEVNRAISDGPPVSEVLISVERLENGNFVKREFNVRRDRVDRISWLRLGLMLGGSMSGGHAAKVSFKSKVEEDKTSGEFKYWYSVANESKETVTIQWEALDIVLGGGFGLPHTVVIKPGESAEVSVATDEFPEFVQKTVYISGLEKETGSSHRKEYEEGKFYEFQTSGADFWFGSMGGIQGAYVPLNWLIRWEWHKNEWRKYWP